MKTYKYYVHGKPKTFDLTTLTDDEIEKFKNMDNTERLRFIELHHLENKPLWDTVDIKTSTKLTDEGLNNEKNYKKYYDLYKNQNIKNKLEQMKKDGKTGEVDENDLKDIFSDEDYKDINDKVKKGYKDIDSLINFYANKIETLNVDSIDTLKAKEIQNLEAANIKLNDTKSLAKAIEKVFPKEYVKKIVEGIEKGDIPESVGVSVVGDDVLGTISGLMASGNNVLADDIKNYFEDLVKKVEAKTGSTITKEDLNSILKTDDLKKELIKEIKEAKEEIKTDIGESAEYIKTSIEDYKNKINELLELQKQGVDYETMLKNMKELLIDICYNYGWNYGKRNQPGFRDGDYKKYAEIDELIDYPNSKVMNEENLTKALIMLCNYVDLPYGQKGPIYERAFIYRKVLKNLYRILRQYDEFKEFSNKYEIKEQRDKEEKKEGEGLEGGKFLNRFKDFEPDIKRLEGMIKEIKNNQETSFDVLKGNIKDIYSELKELKQTKTAEQKTDDSKTFKPSFLNSEESRKYNFLNDISKPKNLKPTETKTYEPEEEHKDLKDILRRRREDIEPDEIEEEDDEDWGEGAHTSQPVPGIKHSKVIKFKELLKMLKS